MKVEFIANACAVFESNSGTKIITDPWLNDGVFNGSWCHFHQLSTKWEDIQDVDAVYVSHVHPDHYDDRFFNFRKDMPIIVLDHGFNFLHKNLERNGYTNLIKIKDGETKSFKDFECTLFAPFAGNNYFEENTKVGNLIDSAIIFKADNQIAFNANDNTPDQKSCSMLRDKFGKFDLSMLNYNAAGPYPSCFDNLSEEEKIEEHHNNLERNISYLHENLKILESKYYLPFAGAYVIGGNRSFKNKYLGTTTWDDCAKKLKKLPNLSTKVICLREQDKFDLDTGEADKEYIPIDTIEVNKYIESKLSILEYPYEKLELPDEKQLKVDLLNSIDALEIRNKRIGIIPDMDVYIYIGNEPINICKANESKGRLDCRLDSRLLKQILNRESHWNNAEIGCHIDFYRSPNYYSPDMHTLLQFLHL
jgi:UDP-MurNAc hydroxylase